MTWAPPPRRKYLGGWHWDSVRASLDAVLAYLPAWDSFARRLEDAETRSRHDSTLVYRWGALIARELGSERPWEYARALTDSAAIHRPSTGAPAAPATELEQQWLQQLAWRDEC